nr:hypothetical protein GCM10010200_050380 [Actinomadura rugatobispora]
MALGVPREAGRPAETNVAAREGAAEAVLERSGTASRVRGPETANLPVFTAAPMKTGRFGCGPGKARGFRLEGREAQTSGCGSVGWVLLT